MGLRAVRENDTVSILDGETILASRWTWTDDELQDDLPKVIETTLTLQFYKNPSLCWTPQEAEALLNNWGRAT